MRTTREPEWTPRQREVLDLLVRGKTNSQIAETLGISLDGAKWHVSEIITRLGVDTRDEAAEYWRHRNGLRMRFTRVLAGFFGSGALKWSAATAFIAGVAVASAMVVVALRNDAGEDTDRSPAVPPGDSTVVDPSNPGAQPTVVVTPPPTTGETVGGVGVTRLSFSQPGSFPVPLSAIVERGCDQCDGAATRYERVTLESSGQLKVDELFKAPNGYISSSLFDRGAGAFYVTVCSRGYCGGVGVPTADAQTTVYRSTDGGVTWSAVETVDAPATVAAITKQGALLNLTTFADGKADYRFRVVGSSTVLRPPAGMEPAKSAGSVIGWQTPDGKTVVNFDGSPLLSVPDLGSHVYEPYGVRLVEILPTGEALISWFHGSEPAKLSKYFGIVKAGQLTSAFTGPASLDVNSWLTLSVAFGNAASEGAGSGRVVSTPVLVDFATGQVQPLELYGPIGGKPYEGDRNRIVLVEPGPFLRVTGTGDCLNVRDSASTGGASLGCFADNVLLRYVGAEQEAGGITWLKVETPDGKTGWASAQYLAGSRPRP